jgi:hypothetical protein
LADEHQASAEDIAHRSDLLGIDVALGKLPVLQKIGQVFGIMGVIGVFGSGGFLELGGIGQMHLIAMLGQAIHEPVPVVGGFNRNMFQSLKALQGLQDFVEVVGKAFAENAFSRFIENHDENIA